MRLTEDLIQLALIHNRIQRLLSQGWLEHLPITVKTRCDGYCQKDKELSVGRSAEKLDCSRAVGGMQNRAATGENTSAALTE